MLIRAPKREKIEAELGRSFESFLKEKLAKGLTPNRIGQEVKLDPSTIRYYIRKFGLPYSPKKTSRDFRFRPAHLDICLCPWCLGELCREEKKAHGLGRCVVVCLNFREGSG